MPDTTAPAGEHKLWATDRLVKAPYHRRTVWGDQRALEASLAERGVIQPLIVRWVKVEGLGRALEVVCGERRRQAALGARLDKVPVIIRDYTDEEAIEVQAAENLDREDLHPIDEGDYYEILTKMGHDVKSLAKKFSRPVAQVKARLALRNLSPVARSAYASGKLTDLQASTIAVLPTPAQQAEVTAACKDGRLDDASVVAYVRTRMLLPLADVPWDLGDESLPGGSCARCPKRTGAQRELFATIAGDADLCTDAKCWRGKSDAAYEATVARARADGLTILATDPGMTFLALAGRRPAVMRSTGYADLDDACPIIPGKTWFEAIGAAELTPDVVLARDTDGRARFLVVEGQVAPKLRRKIAESAPDAPPEGVDPARAEARARREAEVRRERSVALAVLQAPPGFWLRGGAARLVSLVRAMVSPATIKAVAKVADCPPDLLGMTGPVAETGPLDDVALAHRLCACVALLATERGDDQVVAELVAAIERRGDQPGTLLRCKLDTDGDGNCPVHPNGCPAT
jgi:ParB/RepB/Spo0J family partition protein